jgi:hypothetical protein
MTEPDDARTMDELLFELVAETFEVAEPIPPGALEAAYSAFAARNLDEELAELVFDSSSEQELSTVRGAEAETRLLSFSNEWLSLDVELLADQRTVVGQFSPAPPGAVQVEFAEAEPVVVPLDDLGSFRTVVDGGPMRFRVPGRLVTPWISR